MKRKILSGTMAKSSPLTALSSIQKESVCEAKLKVGVLLLR